MHSLDEKDCGNAGDSGKKVDFNEMDRRLSGMKMDVFTGEMIPNN